MARYATDASSQPAAAGSLIYTTGASDQPFFSAFRTEDITKNTLFQIDLPSFDEEEYYVGAGVVCRFCGGNHGPFSQCPYGLAGETRYANYTSGIADKSRAPCDFCGSQHKLKNMFAKSNWLACSEACYARWHAIAVAPTERFCPTEVKFKWQYQCSRCFQLYMATTGRMDSSSVICTNCTNCT